MVRGQQCGPQSWVQKARTRLGQTVMQMGEEVELGEQGLRVQPWAPPLRSRKSLQRLV